MSTTKKDIRTVAIIGTGVIGASWTALFLARGLKVLVTDPAPDAEKNLEIYLKAQWPTLTQIGLSEGASIQNYTFVNSLDNYFGEVDFIQEVRSPFTNTAHLPTNQNQERTRTARIQTQPVRLPRRKSTA